MFYEVDGVIKIGSKIDSYQKLETINYIINNNEDSLKNAGGSLYLTRLTPFNIPAKIYGEFDTERYINSFNHSQKNMGILFNGLKGSGKTLESKLLCKEINLPILVVNSYIKGNELQTFLNSMTQEIVVLIDEFEKLYNLEQQEELLPLLDGVFNTKCLFILICNDLDVSKFILNRTGRIRYLKRFGGVSDALAEEIIEDRLENKTNAQHLKDLVQLMSTVSVDNLLTLIDEMNMYKETALESVRKLNIQVEHSEFDVILFIKGRRFVSRVHYNPLVTQTLFISYKDDSENTGYFGRTKYYECSTDEMTYEVVDKEFHFKDKENNELIFIPAKEFNFEL